MAKRQFFSTSFASSQCRPAELFWVVRGLLHSGPGREMVEPSVARCDKFARHFEDKVAQIRHELDTTLNAAPVVEAFRAPSGPVLLDEFQLLRPEDVDKVLDHVRSTTCMLDP